MACGSVLNPLLYGSFIHSIELHKKLLALNLAMNSIYGDHDDPVTNTAFESSDARRPMKDITNRAAKLSNTQSEPLNVWELTKEINRIYESNSLPQTDKFLMAPRAPMSMPVGNLVPSQGTHSAVPSWPAATQLPSSRMIDSQDFFINSSSYQSLLTNEAEKLVDHFADPKSDTMYEALGKLVEQPTIKQVLDLIKQLPMADRQKWLRDFGLEEFQMYID